MNIYNKTNTIKGTEKIKAFILKWYDKHREFCDKNDIWNEDKIIYMLEERLKQAEQEIKRLQILTKNY